MCQLRWLTISMLADQKLWAIISALSGVFILSGSSYISYAV